jgi:hypothetical protein
MIRFADVTDAYWTNGGAPCCIFIDTTSDTCIAGDDGCHVFDDLDAVRAIPDLGERCAGLVPPGFFERTP